MTEDARPRFRLSLIQLVKLVACAALVFACLPPVIEPGDGGLLGRVVAGAITLPFAMTVCALVLDERGRRRGMVLASIWLCTALALFSCAAVPLVVILGDVVASGGIADLFDPSLPLRYLGVLAAVCAVFGLAAALLLGRLVWLARAGPSR
ncbi:hypothetical protein [Tautonia plasticadhaerens]|uniref:Uncharacterized protein n=1 Tax=Tautonia plasticadhaerens TaxID=2527974 RepID=A0A518H3J0_9BACT|nr:hypothetical protein [Tautonia plasticadhaerens]QDV35416.1 hypothetical protein ElP_33190 [Tautonia plasticadhaerens]